MFEKEAIRHAFEASIGIECLNKPIEDFTYKEISDEQQEKAYDFKKGAEFGYNKANEWHEIELLKAKEIIKDYMTIVKGAHTTVCGVSEENRTINVLKLNKEAEQFISEEEK